MENNKEKFNYLKASIPIIILFIVFYCILSSPQLEINNTYKHIILSFLVITQTVAVSTWKCKEFTFKMTEYFYYIIIVFYIGFIYTRYIPQIKKIDCLQVALNIGSLNNEKDKIITQLKINTSYLEQHPINDLNLSINKLRCLAKGPIFTEETSTISIFTQPGNIKDKLQTARLCVEYLDIKNKIEKTNKENKELNKQQLDIENKLKNKNKYIENINIVNTEYPTKCTELKKQNNLHDLFFTILLPLAVIILKLGQITCTFFPLLPSKPKID